MGFMMYESVILSGPGREELLFMGRLLCYAGMREGLRVTLMPFYWSETRGGITSFTVILSPDRVGSPLTRHPSSVIAMNQASLTRFEESPPAGGLLVINSSSITRDPRRNDLQIIRVPAKEITKKLGGARAVNLAALGAYVEAKGGVALDSVVTVLDRMMPDTPKECLAVDEEALRQGAEVARLTYPRLAERKDGENHH
jgi:2-oxoglutarate ferredoxin oxidoreductase subunit gamma